MEVYYCLRASSAHHWARYITPSSSPLAKSSPSAAPSSASTTSTGIKSNKVTINNNINNIKSTTFRGNQLPAAARENDLSLERPREFLSPIRSNDRQSRTIRSQVVGISSYLGNASNDRFAERLNCCKKSHPCNPWEIKRKKLCSSN